MAARRLRSRAPADGARSCGRRCRPGTRERDPRHVVGAGISARRHPGGSEDALLDELVERRLRRALRHQRQQHETAVAVGESRARRAHLRPAVEHRHERLGVVELMQGAVDHVVGDRTARLVDVVADARRVGQQVLDRDGVVDEREIVAEEGPHQVVERERPVIDERSDRDRGETLRVLATPHRLSAAIGRPWRGPRARTRGRTVLRRAVDADHPAESVRLGGLVQGQCDIRSRSGHVSVPLLVLVFADGSSLTRFRSRRWSPAPPVSS